MDARGLSRRWPRLSPLLLPLLAVTAGVLLPLVLVLELFAAGGPAAWLGAWDELGRDPYTRGVLRFTLLQALASAGLTVVLGLPAALVLGRYRLRGAGTLRALLTVPFIMPTMVAAMGFMALAGPRGWLVHLGGPDLLGTVGLIVLAHAWYNVALVVRLVEPALARLDPAPGEAARLLGAGRWRRFRDWLWPALWPSLGAAATLAFVFSFASFATVEVLGQPHHHTVEAGIYHFASRALIMPAGARLAATLATVQLLVSLAALWTYGALQGRAARMGLARESRRRRPRGRERCLAAAVLTPLVALEVFPLLAVALASVGLPGEATLAYWRAAQSPGARVAEVTLTTAAANSLRYALLTGAVALPLGVLAARGLARLRHGWLLDGLLMAPLGVSAVMVGFGLQVTYDGSPGPDLRVAWWLPLLAHVMVAYPFVLRTTLPALRGLSPAYGEAAATLGAGPWRRWWLVELPLLRRPLAVGLLFAVAVSLGEFGAALLLTRPEWMTLPLLVNARQGRLFDPVASATAYCVATVLMVLALTLFMALERLRLPGQEGEF